MSSFAQRLIVWQQHFGRRDLPWQNTKDPYLIWLSEIMLQQTQVATVIPYFTRFVSEFPSLRTLAASPLERVLELWSGLGYYGRARNLHACAKCVVEQWGGEFPKTVAEIEVLPGIGRSTAAAIGAFAYGLRSPILDGNVQRVLARHRGIDGVLGERSTQQKLWCEAEGLLPAAGVESYTQALMDLGATLCIPRNPRCLSCPVSLDCVARCTGRLDELPQRRVRPQLPVRHAMLLLITSDARVLLERRRSPGIWGGLWSLPELPTGREADEFCRSQFGIEVVARSPLQPFKHTFTHFKLFATPLPCQVTRLTPCAQEESRMRWLAKEEIAKAALPSPIKQLLSSL